MRRFITILLDAALVTIQIHTRSYPGALHARHTRGQYCAQCHHR